MRPLRICALALGALAIVASSGCAAGSEEAAAADASHLSGLTRHSASEDAATADYVLEMEGVLSTPYFLPSLDEFAKSALVTDVVAGTVESTRTYVMGTGDDVYTDVALRVRSARSASPGSLVTIRESGGIVTLDQIKSNFEGRLTGEEIQRQADKTVDMKIAGQAHSQKGDRVLFFVGGRTTDPGGQFAVARMVDATGSGEYRWMGEAFNHDWISSLRMDQAQKSFALTGEK